MIDKEESFRKGITFDGFNEVLGDYLGDGKYSPGHYMGLLWTISRGKRVEVEVHITPEEFPWSLIDNYNERVAICKEKLRDGIKRLKEKVANGK